MAEEIESPAGENTVTGVTRRSGRSVAAAATVARRGRPAAARPAAAKGPRRTLRPLRSLVILSVVGGLIVSIALPAFSTRQPAAEAMTMQQAAVDDAQTLVVASDATHAALSRQSYDATTQEEIDKKKAQEAAAERARALASSVASARTKINLNMVAPGSGAVRWPLAHIDYIGDGFMSRGGAHQGVDMLTAGGTPIFAMADGVVRISSESYFGYGVAVTIDHVINGQLVSTLYGHMTYGSRQVSAGQTVSAGQLIGLVGSTGSSTANHLHFEVRINGTLVDPLAYLQANAG
ncbi:M23 family metallopeptidase [Microbacterium ulmi]|uniref:M23 family metallopeptidase n=1 Tax=Microbacterium ulmi TaxID=179095 RepID=A0A7Y2Q098_9MICO|nr:M23 family metallopeptidase [Microbacterium ulmi]NII68436.1 murein DD-endopeptidase MepM/ murein hydrolase activator NlpD [Microbacterium ulmi]NNH03042.1 M23 family metallopeptidase [Microbacterium ulmi]